MADNDSEIKLLFNNPASFIFDSDLVEFVGGKDKLKDQTPINEMYYNNFVSKNLLRSAGGIKTGTLVNGALITGERLDLTALTSPYWHFNPTGMLGGDPRIATYLFEWEPQFTGPPAASYNLFIEQKAVGDNTNQLEVRHNAGSGIMMLSLRNAAGGFVGALNVPSFAVAATKFEIAIILDSINGNQYFFVNGLLKDDANFVYARSNEIGYSVFGDSAQDAKCFIDNVQKFDVVQNDEDFPDDLPRVIPQTIYSLTKPTVESITPISMTQLNEMAAAETKPGADEIKYMLKWQNDLYWLNAGVVEISDGTPAQRNTLTEIQAALAIAPIDISPDSAVFLVHDLQSADGESTPELESVTLGYGFFLDPTLPGTCLVTGIVTDNSGKPVVGATVSFESVDHFNNDHFVGPKSKFTTDAKGEFFARLFETATLGNLVDAIITYIDSDFPDEPIEKSYKGLIIPDLPEEKFSKIVADSQA